MKKMMAGTLVAPHFVFSSAPSALCVCAWSFMMRFSIFFLLVRSFLLLFLLLCFGELPFPVLSSLDVVSLPLRRGECSDTRMPTRRGRSRGAYAVEEEEVRAREREKKRSEEVKGTQGVRSCTAQRPPSLHLQQTQLSLLWLFWLH